MKKIIFIIIGIILVALLGRLGWAFWQVQKDEEKIATATVIAIATVPVHVDTVTQAIPTVVAPVIVISTTTVKLSTNQVKSEVDIYGVELYTLRQGITTVEKTIPTKIKVIYTRKFETRGSRSNVDFVRSNVFVVSGSNERNIAELGEEVNKKQQIDRYGTDLSQLKEGQTIIEKSVNTNVKIVYTRSKNEIERKVTETDSSGGVGTTTTTVDLDSKEKLIAGIKLMEKGMATDCQGVSTKECTDNKTILEGLKTTCVPLKTNEDIGMCMIAVAMGAAMGGESGSWSIGQ